MQQSFVTQSTEINLLDIDLTGKTQNELAELAQQALGESLNLARRSVENAWFAGKVLERAKRDTKHGNWGAWLEQHGFSPDIVERVRKLYREYEIPQIAEFASVDAALRAIPPKPKPQPPQSTTRTDLGERARVEVKAQPQEGEKVKIKTYDGEWVEVENTPQPTTEQQIYAEEGREQPIDTQGGVHKERETVQEWTPKTHRLKYRQFKKGMPIIDNIALGDEVILTGADLYYLSQNHPIIGDPPPESVVFEKGKVI